MDALRVVVALLVKSVMSVPAAIHKMLANVLVLACQILVKPLILVVDGQTRLFLLPMNVKKLRIALRHKFVVLIHAKIVHKFLWKNVAPTIVVL